MDSTPVVTSPSSPRSRSLDLQAAYARHQAGRYADAARAYQALLQCDRRTLVRQGKADAALPHLGALFARLADNP